MKLLLLVGLLLSGQETLRGRIDRLVAARLPKGAVAGMLVVDPAGRPLYARDPDRALMPASNAKLFTTAAALSKLGKDFTFVTKVFVIDGDLHVAGAGDPNISGRFHKGDPTAIFKAWAAHLKRSGVRRLGDVVLHGPAEPDGARHPDWSRYPAGKWWNAPVSWFSLNDNCVEVTVSPARRAGAPATITLSPAAAPLKIVNRTTTVERVARGKGVVWSARPGSIVFSRQIALKARPPTWSVAVEDPARTFGTVLIDTLRRAGIPVTGKLVRSTEAVGGARPLCMHTSPLPRTLQVTNTRSQNLYAELLARRVAVADGRPSSFKEAAAAVTRFAAGIGARGTKLADGCGLSRNNRTTARDVVTLLRTMSRRDDFKVFFDSLAVGGGEQGTLRKRLRGERVRGRVHAKTGTINGVDALSGYVETHGGRRLVFSMILNGQKGHASARALIDAVCELLVEQ